MSQYVVELPRSAEVAAAARSRLENWLATEVEPPLLGTARLVVSELATNAFLHGRGTIEMRAVLEEDRLVVDVSDEGESFEHKPRERDLEGLSGRGLAIVDAVASRWGIRNETTHVWFELERARPVGRQPAAAGAAR
jgi:anti-sigma regulatory factor (Ser/Thr protein kinase)